MTSEVFRGDNQNTYLGQTSMVGQHELDVILVVGTRIPEFDFHHNIVLHEVGLQREFGNNTTLGCPLPHSEEMRQLSVVVILSLVANDQDTPANGWDTLPVETVFRNHKFCR
jgi:hypothetical protein